jgi:hypothetical protein
MTLKERMQLISSLDFIDDYLPEKYLYMKITKDNLTGCEDTARLFRLQ